MKMILLIFMILSACATYSDCYEDGQRLLHTWKLLRNIYLVFKSNMYLFFPELVVRNVLNILHEAGFSDGDWYQLGQQLMEMAALKRIKASDHEPSNCMIDTIAQWLQSDLKASWEKLAEAVTKVGGYGEATAKTVQQKAGIGKPNF